MESKKIYLYSGLALVSSLAIYAYVSYKKNKAFEDNQKTSDNGDVSTNSSEETVVTPTGSQITVDQITIPKDLENILKNTSDVASKMLINKTAYTKLSDVNARLSNYVNNGIITNVLGELKKSDVNLGKVVGVVDDKNSAKNPQGRVYKWIKVKPSQESIDEMNKNKSFFEPKLPKATAIGNTLIYYREDTIKL